MNDKLNAQATQSATTPDETKNDGDSKPDGDCCTAPPGGGDPGPST
jgi:hypothetical protein